MNFDICLMPCVHSKTSPDDLRRSLTDFINDWDDEAFVTKSDTVVDYNEEDGQVVFLSCNRPTPDDIKVFYHIMKKHHFLMAYPGMPGPVIANDADASHLPDDFLEDDEPVIIQSCEELEEVIENS